MRSPTGPFLLVGALLTAGGTLALHLASRWPWTWSYLVGVSCATFVLYGHDKLAARSKWTRIPEIVLHGCALVGGSPGALLGQQVFRHKTSKRSFQLVFWGVALVQVALLALFLFMPELRNRF